MNAFVALALGAVPRLVSLTAERSVLRAGASLDPDCCAVLEARVHPPAEGTQVLFAIRGGTGEGRFLGASLSSARAEADRGGTARVLLVSSDLQESCTVEASAGGVGLRKRLEFGSHAADAVRFEPPSRGMESESGLRWRLALPGVAARTAAARELVAAGEQAAVRMATELSGDASPWARASALRVLAAVGKADCLLAARDPDVLVRAEAAHLALDEGALEMLLRDESAFVRSVACSTLSRRRKGAGALKDALLGALSDPSPLVRASAALALEGDPNLGCLARDPDPRPRRAAASGLSLAGPLAEVRKYARDPDALARRSAVCALAARGNDEDMGTLIDALDSGDERLRIRLLSGLRRIARIEFSPPPARQVRKWKEWWEEWKEKPRAERLTHALRLKGSSRRGEAALELLAMGVSGIGPDLLVLLNSPHFENRQDAALAFHLLGEDCGLQILFRDLRDRKWFVRARAVEVCAKVGKEALGALVDALDDQTPSIRRRAMSSLVGLTGKTFGFDPEAPPVQRQRAINRWREFLRSPCGEG